MRLDYGGGLLRSLLLVYQKLWDLGGLLLTLSLIGFTLVRLLEVALAQPQLEVDVRVFFYCRVEGVLDELLELRLFDVLFDEQQPVENLLLVGLQLPIGCMRQYLEFRL